MISSRTLARVSRPPVRVEAGSVESFILVSPNRVARFRFIVSVM
jgi:hypothetical protein